MEQQTIPVFGELLARADVSLLDGIVYGALAHFEASGVAPRAQDIADLVRRDVPLVRRIIIRLERAGLVRRDYTARGPSVPTAYTLLGPKLPRVTLPLQSVG